VILGSALNTNDPSTAVERRKALFCSGESKGGPLGGLLHFWC